MSYSNSSPESRAKKQFSLPPIRDILGEELTSSPSPRMRPLDETFSLGRLRSALSDGPSPGASASRARLPSDSPELGYSTKREVRTGSSAPYTTQASSARIPSSMPSNYVPPYPPQFPPHRQPPDSSAPMRRSSSAMPLSQSLSRHSMESRRPKSNSQSGYDPVQSVRNPQGGLKRSYEGGAPTLVSTVDWEAHKRRGSSDSALSSHSDSSGSSMSAHSMQMPNALQFQPLPHGHLRPTSQHASHAQYGPYNPAPPPQTDYHSPFGVLVADMDMSGVPPADPQRLAILRTLRNASSHDGYPRGYDDHRNPLPTARYECPYCTKRFTRPSSLKIHINSHTGDKPFVCTFPSCGRRFSVQSNMRRHARVHDQNPRKTDESSADELADDDSSRPSPSTSPAVRPKLPPIDVDVNISDTDDSTHSRTAYPKTPQASRVGTSARGQSAIASSSSGRLGSSYQQRSKDI